jgi:hypothetical protein
VRILFRTPDMQQLRKDLQQRYWCMLLYDWQLGQPWMRRSQQP